MGIQSMQRLYSTTLLSATLVAGLAGAALADNAFDTPAAFTGSVWFSGPQGSPAYPGTTVTVTGRGFDAGQEISLLRGDTPLSAEDLAADDEGAFSFDFDLPADAVVGTHPVVVQAEEPDSAAVIDLKVSPDVPLSGADKFDIATAKVAAGVYQVAYSEKNDVLFVASASGRPPNVSSSLQKIDPETLELLNEVTPAAAPAEGDGPTMPFAVYGVAVDDAHGNVWTTNTRQYTVAVYDQETLELVKQFPEGTMGKSRDVVVDESRNRAYVSNTRDGEIAVFDTDTLEQLDSLNIPSGIRRGVFSAIGLAVDEEAGQLYAVSLRTPEAARVDLETGEATLFDLPGSGRATGVAFDPETGRVFAASQGSDDVIAVDGESGEVVFDTPVGATPVNVEYNPVTDQVFVSNRTSDTVTVVDAASGEIVANLDGLSFPNHMVITPDGTAYAVNKARGAEDPDGDHLMRIAPKM